MYRDSPITPIAVRVSTCFPWILENEGLAQCSSSCLSLTAGAPAREKGCVQNQAPPSSGQCASDTQPHRQPRFDPQRHFGVAVLVSLIAASQASKRPWRHLPAQGKGTEGNGRVISTLCETARCIPRPVSRSHLAWPSSKTHLLDILGHMGFLSSFQKKPRSPLSKVSKCPWTPSYVTCL